MSSSEPPRNAPNPAQPPQASAGAPYGAWYPPPGYYPAYGPQGPYYAPYYAYQPPRPPRDTYRLVVGIITTIMLSLLLLGGLLGLLISLLGPSINNGVLDGSLAFWLLVLPPSSVAIVGGGFGLFLAIRALMGRPSARMQLPPFVLPLGLFVALLGASIVLFDTSPPATSALAETPLIFACVVMPPVAILAFTSQRLGNPSTWRHIWPSVLNGFFLAVLIAVILELLLGTAAAIILKSDLGSALQSPSSVNIILTLVVGSLIAPLCEESTKPIGAIVILGRLRGPAEAFLVGMAGGLGFAIFESLEYVGLGGADWPSIVIERVGSGLLHGTGAAMTALGFYYLFRGAGVARRYLKGFGAIGYALGQHAIWNALAVLLVIIPGPVGNFMNAPFFLFGLPLQGGDAVFLLLYGAMVTALVIITGRLRGAPQHAPKATTAAPPAGSPLAPPAPEGAMAR